MTGSPEIPIANSRTVTALSNSQESSLNESSNSQLSQYRPESAGDLHPSQAKRGHGEMTPSTSYTNSPTYECIPKGHPNDDVGVITQDKLESAHALNMRPLPDQSKEPLIEYTAAPKRMANGDIKPAGYSSPTSPIDASQYGHSRNSSRASRSSQIGEVCESPDVTIVRTILTETNSYPANYVRASHMPWSKFKMAGSHTVSLSLRG